MSERTPKRPSDGLDLLTHLALDDRAGPAKRLSASAEDDLVRAVLEATSLPATPALPRPAPRPRWLAGVAAAAILLATTGAVAGIYAVVTVRREAALRAREADEARRAAATRDTASAAVLDAQAALASGRDAPEDLAHGTGGAGATDDLAHGTGAAGAADDLAHGTGGAGATGDLAHGTGGAGATDDLAHRTGSRAEPSRAERPRAPRRDGETRRAVGVDVAEDRLAAANVLRGQRRWRDAERTYLAARDAAPRSRTAYVASIAAAQLRVEHLSAPRAAIALYREARALEPAGPLDAELLFGLAAAHRALGDVAAERAALDELRRAHAASVLAEPAKRRLAELERAP